MAIKTIGELTEIQSAGANDVLLIETENGPRKIKASAVGGSGGDATADLTLIAVATGITSSGNNGEAITGYSSFTLTVNKDFDALLAKARTKFLSLDGSVSWTDTQTTAKEVRPVSIWKQEVAPSSAIVAFGIQTEKDGVIVYIDSFLYKGEAQSDSSEVYRRMGLTICLIYEDTDGNTQIVDLAQGG